MVGVRAPRTPLPIEGEAVLKLCPRCRVTKGCGEKLKSHIKDCNVGAWRNYIRQEEEEVEVPDEPVALVVNVGGRGGGRGAARGVNVGGRGAGGVLAVGQVPFGVGVGLAGQVVFQDAAFAEGDVYGRGRGRGRGRGHGHH